MNNVSRCRSDVDRSWDGAGASYTLVQVGQGRGRQTLAWACSWGEREVARFGESKRAGEVGDKPIVLRIKMRSARKSALGWRSRNQGASQSPHRFNRGRHYIHPPPPKSFKLAEIVAGKPNQKWASTCCLDQSSGRQPCWGGSHLGSVVQYLQE